MKINQKAKDEGFNAFCNADGKNREKLSHQSGWTDDALADWYDGWNEAAQNAYHASEYDCRF